MSRLLATVEDNPRLAAFVLLCPGGGSGRGEVLGLTWGAINVRAEDAHKSFKRACEKAGLASDTSSTACVMTSPHCLPVSDSAARGDGRAGHSQELTTIYYQHASDSDRRGAADKVGAWFARNGRGHPINPLVAAALEE